MGNLESLIEERIEADVDFQNEIVDLDDDEKSNRITQRKSELIDEEFATRDERAKKAEEIANNYKVRAEKAERRKSPAGDLTPRKDELTPTDILALVNVHEDDREEVIKAARLLGKPINDAVKDDTLKAILNTRKELRSTADATNTRTARPSQKAVSDAQLTKDLSEGKVPEPGSDEAERLFWARKGGKPE